MYYTRDKERGIEKTFLWLVEEVGELAEVVRKNDLDGIHEELADVLAWAASVANLLEVDIEEILRKKYPATCVYCKDNPCSCVKS